MRLLSPGPLGSAERCGCLCSCLPPRGDGSVSPESPGPALCGHWCSSSGPHSAIWLAEYSCCCLFFLLRVWKRYCLKQGNFKNRWVVVSRHHVSKIVIEARSQPICLFGTRSCISDIGKVLAEDRSARAASWGGATAPRQKRACLPPSHCRVSAAELGLEADEASHAVLVTKDADPLSGPSG